MLEVGKLIEYYYERKMLEVSKFIKVNVIVYEKLLSFWLVGLIFVFDFYFYKNFIIVYLVVFIFFWRIYSFSFRFEKNRFFLEVM